QYEQAADLAAIVDPERRQQRIDAGVVPFETAENEARAAGAAHFTALRDQADVAAAAWRALGDALDSRAGADAPPTSRVRDILEGITTVAARFAAPDGDGPIETAPGSALATTAPDSAP